jgi:hypothetical protein
MIRNICLLTFIAATAAATDAPALAEGEICYRVCFDKVGCAPVEQQSCGTGLDCVQKTGIRGLQLSSWSAGENASFEQQWTCQKSVEKKAAPAIASLRGSRIAKITTSRRLTRTVSPMTRVR